MTVIGIMLAYLACSALAFWLFVRDWRRDFDFTTHNLAAHIGFSGLGPVSLITALLITLAGWFRRRRGPRRVIWERLP